MNIPEGYVLVPVELTQEMIQAGIDTERVDTGDADFDELQDYRSVYKSFLESAPKSPVYDEAKERELFESRFGFTNDEQEIYFIPELNCYGSSRVNEAANNKSSAWYWWQACAKSRARSAE